MSKEILIYDIIGEDWWTGNGVTAKGIVAELKAIEDSGEKDVLIRINSPGGSVFDGVAIYNSILNSKLNINTQIDGIAYSMAAIIALAGNKVTMARSATLLLHNASGVARGNANDLRGTVEMLDKLDNGICVAIADKTGLSLDDVKAKWFDYRDHTLSMQDALDAKLIDGEINANALPASNFKDAAEAMNFFNTKKQKEFISNEIRTQFQNIKPTYTPTL